MGWEACQGFSSANIMVQPLYHLQEFLWDSVQALYNPVLPAGRTVAERQLVIIPGGMCLCWMLCRGHTLSKPGLVCGNPGPVVALLVSSSSTGCVVSSLPAEKMQLLLHSWEEGRPWHCYLVFVGVTCQMALGFSFLFLYPIQGLFKEHEVQSSLWWALLPIHAHTCSLSLAL